MSDDDHVNRAIEEIEGALQADDPLLLRSFRDLEQRPGTADGVVFSLLAVSAVLLSVGLATASAPPWYMGVATYSACFLVDHQNRRHQRTTPGKSPKRQAD